MSREARLAMYSTGYGLVLGGAVSAIAHSFLPAIIFGLLAVIAAAASKVKS